MPPLPLQLKPCRTSPADSAAVQGKKRSFLPYWVCRPFVVVPLTPDWLCAKLGAKMINMTIGCCCCRNFPPAVREVNHCRQQARCSFPCKAFVRVLFFSFCHGCEDSKQHKKVQTNFLQGFFSDIDSACRRERITLASASVPSALLTLCGILTLRVCQIWCEA